MRLRSPDPHARLIRNLGEMVVSASMAGIVTALSGHGSRGLGAVAAEFCAEVLGVTGVAVSVPLAGGGDVVWRTDGISVRLDDLQFTLGEGPGIDAVAAGAAGPVHR